MTQRSAEDWRRLGRAVKRARLAHPKYRDTAAWAIAIKRSTRIALGLERGESVGDGTLMAIEEALGWPADRSWRILDGLELDAETVTPPGDGVGEEDSRAGGYIRNRKPEGLTDEQWQRIKERSEAYIQGQVDSAAQER